MTDHHQKSRGLNRRKFFTLVANAGTLAAGAIGWLGYRNISFKQWMPGTLSGDSYRLHAEMAEAQQSLPMPEPRTNGDEERYTALIGAYSKGLPHNPLGEVDRYAYRMLLKALATGKASDFDAIPMGGPIKLANPQAALSRQLSGAGPEYLHMPPPPAFASEEQGTEMAELYWQALARDVPFYNMAGNPLRRQPPPTCVLSNPFAKRLRKICFGAILRVIITDLISPSSSTKIFPTARRSYCRKLCRPVPGLILCKRSDPLLISEGFQDCATEN